MKKIILFNGPPRSGKDTATGFALEYLGCRGVQYRFAAPLKDAIHGLFGMPSILLEHFDAVKDEPNEKLFGMTPRNAYIWLSEEVVKPKFGKDFFTRVAINAIKSMGDNIIVISDCGFAEEAEGLIKEFGAENIIIVRLHRRGTSFANDSRNYISHPECKEYAILNNGSFEHLQLSVREILHAIA